jgi:hypothetical protein
MFWTNKEYLHNNETELVQQVFSLNIQQPISFEIGKFVNLRSLVVCNNFNNDFLKINISLKMSRITIFQLYKKLDGCDFLPHFDIIAETPDEIKEQLEFFNAVEDKNHKFHLIFDEVDYIPVVLEKVYKTNGATLFLVAMTKEVYCLQIYCATHCFDIKLIS